MNNPLLLRLARRWEGSRAVCSFRKPGLLFLFLLLMAVAVPGMSASTGRPNIIFIFSDDHAVQAIGAYGSRINETPNIDRLADEGAIFENSFCGNSLCGPSRATILTGKHSFRNGFLRNGDQFDGGQVTFPKLLQQAGYQTALIGKWHLGTDPTGFDYWEILPGQGSYYNPHFLQMDGSRKQYEGYVTDIITDQTIEWLKNRGDSDEPFLLMSQHKAPHRNWSPHPRHFELFKDEPVPEPSTLLDDYSGRTKLLQESEMSIRDHFYWGHDMKFHGKNLFPEHFMDRTNYEYRRMNDEQKKLWDAHYGPENEEFIKRMEAGELSDDDIVRWKYQRYIKDYLGTIAAVDDGVGRILEYLDETGEAENTIVIYGSDQGFYLGEHGWYDKRWMFEESLKMPFLIRWPGVVEPGTRPTAAIQNIDYAPTFLEIAGAEIPGDIHGRSLVPVLRDTSQRPGDWRDAIYYSYYENDAVHEVPIHDGIRTDRYKLMFFPRTTEWQLFDLETDPREMRSVHAESDYAGVLEGMQKRYHDLRRYYEVNSAAIPASRGDVEWWKTRQAAVNERAKQGDVDLAFIGDSITQGWERAGREVWDEFYQGRKPINLGFGGDRTEHVIWRLTRGNLSNIRPKVAVVMIGTNNTGHLMQDPREVAEGVEKILGILGQETPETKVLLLGIFPRGADAMDEHRLNNVAINQYIRRFAHQTPNVICFTGFEAEDPHNPNSRLIGKEEGADNCVEGLKKIVGYAEKNGITLCLEHLNTRDDTHAMTGHPGYQGDQIDYCVDIIKRVGSPNLKLLFDIYHVQLMDGDIIRRIHQHKDYLGHIHTAGVPGRNEIDDTQELNYRPIMQALLDVGYTGYVGQEFLPTRDAYSSLHQAISLCDV